MNKNERMSKLNNAGVDTSKYFNIELPNGLKAGSTISVRINENGEPVIVDSVAKQIIEDGYVKNTKLHRRFVMAQMFQMLNYVSYDGMESGFDAYLRNHYGYDYQFKMMLEEIKVLSKLEVRDFDTFKERASFFTKEVVVEVCKDYANKLKNHIDGYKTLNCKGVPYKKVRGVNIFCSDLNKKIFTPLAIKICKIRCARNYVEMYKALSDFTKNMIKLPYYTPKCKMWVDTYKGEGAYYTLKNLIMFHNCGVMDVYGVRFLYGTEAMNELNMRLKDYQGEGWRMFAFMKKVIKDNNFNFSKAMNRIYNN